MEAGFNPLGMDDPPRDEYSSYAMGATIDGKDNCMFVANKIKIHNQSKQFRVSRFRWLTRFK
jgi:hypothetical protein